MRYFHYAVFFSSDNLLMAMENCITVHYAHKKGFLVQQLHGQWNSI